MKKRQCSYKSTFNAWNYRNCKRGGVVRRGINWYCKQHDPVAIRAKRDAAEQKYQEQYKRNQESRDRRQVLEKLAKNIETKNLHKYRLILQGLG